MGPLALLLLACPPEPSDPKDPVTAPAPWEALPEAPLDPWRTVLRVPADHGGAPSRVFVAPAGPTTLVLDALGAVHLFDGRFRHGPRAWCVPLRDWEHLADGVDRRGRCEADEAEVRPGEWAPEVPIVAVATVPDGDAAVALDADGTLWRAALGWGADDNPLDHGRLREIARTGITGGRLLAVTADGRVHVATETRLVTLDADGAELEARPLASAPTDLRADGDHVWIAGPDGIARDGVSVSALPAARLAPDDEGGVWATAPSEGRVVRIDAGGAVRTEVALEGLTGPLTRDPRDGTVRVLAADAVVTFAADGTRRDTRTLAAPVLDLATTAAGEVALLEADGALSVVVDETSFPAGPPLRAYIAAFVENPREEGAGVPCTGGTPNITDYVRTAERNRAWLDDVPATVALGVTPTAARRAEACGLGAALGRVVAAERTESGVLFHDAPDCGTDTACFADDLRADVQTLTEVGAIPTWSSGLASWDTEQDWVAGLAAAGAPMRLIFFGLAGDPELPHADPRGKEPLPWRGDVPPAGWSVDVGADLARRAPGGDAFDGSLDGALTAWPGMNAPGFHLGACPNLPVVVCDRVRAGGGDAFDAEDVAVLDLLLRRALALRDPATTSTWSFHLPALEAWDYTEGCDVAERRWGGASCEAALLQSWTFDVHARFVETGYLQWTLPSELP
jgi:hypothetical protein